MPDGNGRHLHRLICLIALTVSMGKIVKHLQPAEVPAPQTTAAPAAPAEVPGNRQEMIAAVAACIAEELGILSFKKVS